MKRNDIFIRDPFVLLSNGTYYLYGTRSATCWGPANGFDVYTSKDLKEFEGPFEIFHKPEGFFATESYWAPECYEINGAFYLLSTFGSQTQKKGAFLLKANAPLGPFEPYSLRLTPEDWTCIDGTLYFEDETPYLIFSHSFEDILDPTCATSSYDGDFCILELSDDLTRAVSAPTVLFSAKEAAFSKPIPFAKAEFGIDEDIYFSDGPFLMKLEDGRLHMIFSSWSTRGYAVGAAVSEGGVMGPWKLQESAFYPEDGGHGMFFRDLDHQLVFTLHNPNTKYHEHPAFYHFMLIDEQLKLGDSYKS